MYKQTNIQTDNQTTIQTDKQKNVQSNQHTNRQSNKHTNKRTTNIQTDIQTNIKMLFYQKSKLNIISFSRCRANKQPGAESFTLLAFLPHCHFANLPFCQAII